MHTATAKHLTKALASQPTPPVVLLRLYGTMGVMVLVFFDAIKELDPGAPDLVTYLEDTVTQRSQDVWRLKSRDASEWCAEDDGRLAVLADALVPWAWTIVHATKNSSSAAATHDKVAAAADHLVALAEAGIGAIRRLHVDGDQTMQHQFNTTHSFNVMNADIRYLEATCHACVVALSVLGMASARWADPVSTIVIHLERMLSLLYSVGVTGPVPHLTSSTAVDIASRAWQQAHALLPTHGPLMAMAGWSGLGRVLPLPKGSVTTFGGSVWALGQIMVAQTRRTLESLFRHGHREQVLAQLLTAASTLNTMVNTTTTTSSSSNYTDDRTTRDVCALGTFLACVGTSSVLCADWELVSTLTTSFVATLSSAGPGATAEDLGAVTFAVCAIVGSHARQEESLEPRKEPKVPVDTTDHLIDLPSSTSTTANSRTTSPNSATWMRGDAQRYSSASSSIPALTPGSPLRVPPFSPLVSRPKSHSHSHAHASPYRTLVETTVDVIHAIFAQDGVKGRIGLAYGLTHLASAVAETSLAESLAVRMNHLVYDACWDLDLSSPGVLFRAPSRGRTVKRDEVVALVPAASHVLSGWMRQMKAKVSWNGTYRGQDIIAESQRSSLGVQLILSSTRGCEPDGYDDTIELLDNPARARYVRYAMMMWFLLDVVKAQHGLRGVDAHSLGLGCLAASTPAIFLAPGYQANEVLLDFQVLLDRLWGYGKKQKAKISTRQILQYRIKAAGATILPGTAYKALKKCGIREAARMVALDLLNQMRSTALERGDVIPEPWLLAVTLSELHFADAGAVPWLGSLVDNRLVSFGKALQAAKTRVRSHDGALEVMEWAKVVAMLCIKQLRGANVGQRGGQETTAPPPEKSGMALARKTALRVSTERLYSEILTTNAEVLYSQRCLDALLAMSLGGVWGGKGVLTKKKSISRKLSFVDEQSSLAATLLERWIHLGAMYAPDTIVATVGHLLVKNIKNGDFETSARSMHMAQRVMAAVETSRSLPAFLAPVAATEQVQHKKDVSRPATSEEAMTIMSRKIYFRGVISGRLMGLLAPSGDTAEAYATLVKNVVEEYTTAAQSHDGQQMYRSIFSLAALVVIAHEDTTDYALSRFRPTYTFPDTLLDQVLDVVVSRALESLDTEIVRAALTSWNWISAVLPNTVPVLVIRRGCVFLVRSAEKRRGMFSTATLDSISTFMLDKVKEEIRSQSMFLVYATEIANLHDQGYTTDAQLIREAIHDMHLQIRPALSDQKPRPTLTLHARLHFCLLIASTVVGEIGIRHADVSAGPRHLRASLVARDVINIFSETLSPWCNHWSIPVMRIQNKVTQTLRNTLNEIFTRLQSFVQDDAVNEASTTTRTTTTRTTSLQKDVDEVSHEIRVASALCVLETDRLTLWISPLSTHQEPHFWREVHILQQHAATVWRCSPTLVVRLIYHLRGNKSLVSTYLQFVRSDGKDLEWSSLRHVPMAAKLLVDHRHILPATDAQIESLLAIVDTGNLEDAVQMLAMRGDDIHVRTYALRCLRSKQPREMLFFMPQLVQALRHECHDATLSIPSGPITEFLVKNATESDMFAHRIYWMLRSEGSPPDAALNPSVKRSGWTPPKDSGLWTAADSLRDRIVKSLSPVSQRFLEREDGFFEAINATSDAMASVVPIQRKAHLAKLLAEVNDSYREELDRAARTSGLSTTSDAEEPLLYMPMDPSRKVVRAVVGKGNVMPSAAKFPVMVFLETKSVGKGDDDQAVEEQQDQDRGLRRLSSASSVSTLTRETAYIFKVGDDVRQDVLALQIIDILSQAFRSAGLESYLCPYGCLPNGYEKGLIEVVPNCNSRAAIGQVADGGLHDIFMSRYGAPGGAEFEEARRNFIHSSAGYAVASYLLQAKDRHNGNILIDDHGHMIHIDFGFILEISPAANLNFEKAGFKLSHDMTQIVDPGGKKKSEEFAYFVDLCIRGYLIARTRAEDILATVGLMQDSGLPCFGRGRPIENLRKRFRLDLTPTEAGNFFRRMIFRSYDRWSTKFYDIVQLLQNQYPH